ncbi:MAG: hypothetical protein WCB92_12945, partial [Mycobacterium sp.]
AHTNPAAAGAPATGARTNPAAAGAAVVVHTNSVGAHTNSVAAHTNSAAVAARAQERAGSVHQRAAAAAGVADLEQLPVGSAPRSAGAGVAAGVAALE